MGAAANANDGVCGAGEWGEMEKACFLDIHEDVENGPGASRASGDRMPGDPYPGFSSRNPTLRNGHEEGYAVFGCDGTRSTPTHRANPVAPYTEPCMAKHCLHGGRRRDAIISWRQTIARWGTAHSGAWSA